jgi:hypothetical protein
MHSKLKNMINSSNLYRFLFGTANKKSKLISTNNNAECGFNTAKNLQHRQHHEASGKTKAGKVHQQQTGAASVDFEQQLIQDHESLYNGLAGDLKRDRGPLSNLVNKQLVLPMIAFNSNGNESNHLIKPSEYLKSIVTDKRSSPR